MPHQICPHCDKRVETKMVPGVEVPITVMHDCKTEVKVDPKTNEDTVYNKAKKGPEIVL